MFFRRHLYFLLAFKYFNVKIITIIIAVIHFIIIIIASFVPI